MQGVKSMSVTQYPKSNIKSNIKRNQPNVAPKIWVTRTILYKITLSSFQCPLCLWLPSTGGSVRASSPACSMVALIAFLKSSKRMWYRCDGTYTNFSGSWRWLCFTPTRPIWENKGKMVKDKLKQSLSHNFK